MSKQTINIGASPNDGTGTPLRTSFDYTNQNFTEIYTALGGGVALPGATTQVIFNDGGTNLAGDAGLVYNKTTDALTVAGLVTAGSATITGDLTVQTNALFVNSANNNVGLGTLTPTGASGRTLEIYGAAGQARLAFKNDTTGSASGDGSQIALVGSQLIIQNRENSEITFEINSVERARFLTTGAFVLSGGNVNATGVGVTFPATQVASTDANTLDDYEEGTFTPTVTSSGGTGIVYTPVGDTGTYTKVGRLVTFTVNLSGTYTGTFTYIIIALPFTVGAVNDSVIGYNNSTAGAIAGRTDSTFARFIIFNFQSSGASAVYTGSYNV
jgi:hypothetical protein